MIEFMPVSGINKMSKMSNFELTEWLVDGFITHHLDSTIMFPFSSHSFVHNYYEVSEGLEALYNSHNETLNKKLTASISQLLIKVKDNISDTSFEIKDRVRLLDESFRLARSFHAVNAIPAILDIILNVDTFQIEDTYKEQFFQSGLFSIGRIVQSAKSGQISRKYNISRLSGMLYNFAGNRYFKDTCSLFLFNILIILEPQKRGKYLGLLSS